MQQWNVRNRIRAMPVTDMTTFLPIEELINHIMFLLIYNLLILIYSIRYNQPQN